MAGNADDRLSRGERWAYYIVSFILIFSLCIKLGKETVLLPWNDWGSWGISEFLINFKGGFVRRGFVGEFLWILSSKYGINPTHIIIPLCYICYVAVLWIFFRLFRRRRLNWWFVVSPFLCGVIVYLIRKDYLLILMLLGSLALIRNFFKGSAHSLLLVWILSLCGLFLHEAYIFWGIPLICLLIYSHSKSSGFSFGCGMILSFFVLAAFKGDMSVAQAINDSWRSFWPQYVDGTPRGAVDAVGWESAYAFKFHLSKNFIESDSVLPAFVFRPLVLLASWYLIANLLHLFRQPTTVFTSADRTNLTALYFFSLICLVPMFTVLSCDYARLYQYAFAASFGVFLLFSADEIARIFPRWFYRFVKKCNDAMDRVVKPDRWVAMGLMLVTAACTAHCDLPAYMANSPLFSIVHYCGGFLERYF